MTQFSADRFHKARRVLAFQTPARYCRQSGKVIFDKRGAVTAKNDRFEKDHVRLRIYECPACRGWHLTKRLKWGERATD